MDGHYNNCASDSFFGTVGNKKMVSRGVGGLGKDRERIDIGLSALELLVIIMLNYRDSEMNGTRCFLISTYRLVIIFLT